MRNFLRIRNGDRFWYERYLSEEVNKRINKSRLFNFTMKIQCLFKCRRFEADTYKEFRRLGNTAVSTDLTKNNLDWQTNFTFTWLWSLAVPLRLSKHQSSTTVLFWTSLTWTITRTIRTFWYSWVQTIRLTLIVNVILWLTKLMKLTPFPTCLVPFWFLLTDCQRFRSKLVL